MLIALKEQVFEIMGQAGRIRRIVFTARAYGDFRIKTWLFMVFGQIDSQTVVELIDGGVERIIGVAFIYAGIARRGIHAGYYFLARLGAGDK